MHIQMSLCRGMSPTSSETQTIDFDELMEGRSKADAMHRYALVRVGGKLFFRVVCHQIQTPIDTHPTVIGISVMVSLPKMSMTLTATM